MRWIILLIVSFIAKLSLAQGIVIKEVKETISGTDAFHAPTDKNGNPCGLVKILSTIEDLTFDGPIVGDIENKTNEYHVFLAKGSQEIKIKRPHVLPIVIKFADYGIEKIVSKATYSIVLKEIKMNANKNSIAFSIHPKEADVYIDDILIDNENGDGFYQLLLPKGEHVIRFEARGFRSLVEIIKTGKDAINNKYELESLLAILDVRCQTSTAEIWVGDEMKGKGAWQGKLPAGIYKVTAKQKGFTAQTKEITLEEKGSRSLVLPILERVMGKLFVCTDPKGAVLSIDGQSSYKSGVPIDVKSGQHTIIATLPFGYKEGKAEVEVGGEKMDSIFIDMKPKNDLYAAAFKGDIDKQLQILNNYIDSLEGDYWCRRINEEILKMDDKSFVLYCNKACSTYRYIDILLRKVKLDKGWLSDENKDMEYGFIRDYYESQGNLNEAIKWQIKICEMTTHKHLAYKELAQLYEKAGDKRNAILSWKKAADDKWDVESWASVDLADAYYRLGYKTEAIRCYKDLLNNWDEGLYKEMKNEWRKKLSDLSK